MKTSHKLIGTILAGVVAVSPWIGHANPLDDYAKTQQQLSDQAAKVKTLSDELNLLDQQITAKSDYLTQVSAEADKIRAQLAEVNRELTGMQQDREHAQAKLHQLVRADYLDGRTDAYYVLASTGSLSSFTQATSYIGIVQDKTDGVVNHLDQVERLQNERQRDVTSQVRRLDDLEGQASKEAQELNAIRDSKRQLLDSTQGQEDLYQQQFNAERDQLVKLGIFGKSGCSRVGSHVISDVSGYFNQCDPRWADVHLGFSDSSTIGDYGCGVTSLAMVYEYYGIDTDPLRMNEGLKRTGGFVDDLMQWRAAAGPSGGALSLANNPYGGVDWNQVNGQLDGGNPVIVYINRGVTNHYVVLLRRDGSTYRMNDPIEGPNLRFSDHYSTGAVQQYVTFHRN